jgi:hypothetical protein
MSCNIEPYYRLRPIIDKLEVITRLAPVTDSNEELAWTLSTLLIIAHDYTMELHATLNRLAGEEEGQR